MFIIRNIPEHKYFADIKHVTIFTVTADSPDLSDSVTELAYSMLKSFTSQMGTLPVRRRISLHISIYILFAKCCDLHVINMINVMYFLCQ